MCLTEYRFLPEVLSKSQTSYTISWVTESFTPIDEYKLLYRRLPVSNLSINFLVL